MRRRGRWLYQSRLRTWVRRWWRWWCRGCRRVWRRRLHERARRRRRRRRRRLRRTGVQWQWRWFHGCAGRRRGRRRPGAALMRRCRQRCHDARRSRRMESGRGRRVWCVVSVRLYRGGQGHCDGRSCAGSWSCAGRYRPHCDGSRRPDKIRYGGRWRSRQKETLTWRRWRRQHGEFARPRRQEERWRRWRPAERWIFENHDGPTDKNEFVGRRRRHAKIIQREIRRRFELRPQHRQAPPRVPGVRSFRIAAQIRPIGRRRIRDHTTAPHDRLAADGEHRGDAPRIWTIRIKPKELLISGDRVDRERRGIGVIDAAKLTHRPVADIGERQKIRWRRRAGDPFGHEKRTLDLRRVPRNLDALRHVADAEANPGENIVERQTAGRDHFRQRSGIGAVRALFTWRDRARRGIEGNCHVAGRID